MPDSEATWSSAFRRLVVIAIYVVVAMVTVLAVQRPFGRDLPGGSVARSAGDTQVLRSGSRVPPVNAKAGTGKNRAGQGSGDQVPARPAEAIDGLLQARAAAIRDGDKAAWLAGLAQRSGARVSRFRTAQAAVFDRVRTLRPVSWTYQVAGGYPLPAARRAELGGVAWLADVQLDYRLTAGGPAVRRQQFLTMVPGAGGWLIADDTDGQTGRDLWDLGPVVRASSPRCLVIG